MNRSAKGFGLWGVVAAVLFLMVTALFNARAEAAEGQQGVMPQPERQMQWRS